MHGRFHIGLIVILLLGKCAWAQSIPDSTQADLNLPAVEITSSRIAGSVMKAPQSLTQLTARDAKLLGAPTVFDAIESMRGVQVTTAGLGFKVINTRGFSNTTNVRFTQLVDGIDNQAPHIGAPIGNALGASELDIDKVELVAGTASSLYGMNAINGLLNIRTKNPFDSPGLTVQQLSGVNHLGDGGLSPKFYDQTNARYAVVLHPKWALKVNAGLMHGYDFVANDSTDLAPNLNASVGLKGDDNPAFDAVNGYGNESSNRRILTLGGKKYAIARTGYREVEVADYQLQNLKGDIGLYFRPHPGHELIYSVKGALLDNTYQRSNRFRLENYGLMQQAVTYTAPAFEVHGYWTLENTGQSYNLRSLAENMDRASKSDNAWFADYATAYNAALGNGLDVAAAHHAARVQADAGRLQPGTDAFDAKKKELIQINNWDQGAALRVRADLLHLDGMLNWAKVAPLPFTKLGAELLTGFDQRSYVIVPDGNYFINPELPGHNLIYSKFGGFVQGSKLLLAQRLKLSATLRADRAQYFDWKFNPRLTAVFAVTEQQTVRASYQSGFRYPSIFEGFSNVNSGGVKRVGGLPIMSQGIFEQSYTKASIDAFQAAVVASVNGSGLTQAQAIAANQGLLKKNPYTYLQPEFVRSFEAGYRGTFLHKRLFVDAEGYYNAYDNFIAQVEASVPNTSISDSIPTYLFDKTKQQRYRLWTNSQSRVFSYGANLGLRYRISPHLVALANASFAKLDRTDRQDGLEDGFNTPRWMLNGSLTADHIWKNLSGSIGGRYQTKYDYVSFLVSGTTPAYWTLDAALNYEFNKAGLVAKLGASNLLNRPYVSMLGGPTVGGVYYLSVVWNL